MASGPLPRTLQPPPDVPVLAISGGDSLAAYLRTFALWCRHGFADKLSVTTAVQGVLIQAHDAPAGTTPKVFMLQVTMAGTIVATPVPLGGGKP